MTVSGRDSHSEDADILLESSDSVKFCVHRCILASASPFFEHMFSLPQPPSDVKEHRPVVPVSEHSSTLGVLLQFIYPEPDPVIASLDELVTLLATSVKYDFLGPIAALRKELLSPRFLEESPTRVYAIASRFDLEYEAQVASRHTLSCNVLDCPLSDDLKFISAHAYHRLLVLHRTRSEAAQALLKISQDVKCMQCSGPYYGAFVPPKWWKEYERLAKEELAIRPTTDVIFSMPFLARVAQASACVRCSGSIIDAHAFFAELKKQIDDLPGTI
ncbi:hypothetical protein PAXRUDRAFT_31262 [Paxillus rubicundulus Ve08.2h10]|uniref:BTB domain-containing protein n=1 Tax=Paxillus rubicundulus Ve08.2h10 TaxID=930991 RepID=A0A0D0DUW1_9AGAM|nr:hypothetical protein PAXRUDRAFT_31262 [Paxillus rubicundulus Ve08.2h10]